MSHECSLYKWRSRLLTTPALALALGKAALGTDGEILASRPCLWSCCHHSTDACFLRTFI